MDNLFLLKKIACDYNVLIVEDSKHIVLKLKEFLEKFFVEIDFASDGLEGIEKFKKKKYDIVLTDINMPKLDGNMLVQQLTSLDPNVQVIVISAFGYDENMVLFNKYGIVDFIQKPINNMRLIDALLTSIENIKLINNDSNQVSYSLDKNTFEKINAHKESNDTIELINFFKGVSIIQKGFLKDINQNTITVKTTSSQYYLIKCEKRTVLIVGDIVLRTNLQYVDKNKEQLIFKKFEQLDRSPKDRKVPRVTPDQFFTLSRLYKGETFTYDVLAVSVNSISVKTSNLDEEFQIDTVVDLIMGFHLFYDTHFDNKKREKKLKHVKIKAKAQILKVDRSAKGIKRSYFY